MSATTDLTAYRFGNALIPANWTVCGVRLKPFCLGHYILLEQVANPLVADAVESTPITETLVWFFSALLICAQSYEDNLKMLADDSLHKELLQDFTKNLQKNMKAEKDWNIFSKLALFKEYLNYYMDVPVYNEEHETKAPIPSGTDWKQNIFLIFKKLGYKESDILNMNFKRLFYEWCSYAESEGAIRTWNKQDLTMLARSKGLL